MKLIPEIKIPKKEEIPLPREENKTKIRIIINGRKKDDITIILSNIIKNYLSNKII